MSLTRRLRHGRVPPGTVTPNTPVTGAPMLLWGATIGTNQYALGTGTWPTNTTTDSGGSGYDHFTANSGKAPTLVQTGHSWQNAVNGSPAYFNTTAKAKCDAIISQGAIPLLTWSPQASGGGASQPGYRTAVIATGSALMPGQSTSFATYVDTYATQVLAWMNGGNALGVPVPLFLRTAHEMNLVFSGGWAWSDGQNGNSAGATSDHKTYWQWVYNRFKAICPNVTFVWCVNEVTTAGSSTIAQLFPGDAYMDWAGIDCYAKSSIGTTTFTAIVDDSPTLAYTSIIGLTGKPIVIPEIGVVDGTSNQKATWLTNMLSTEIPFLFPAVKGFCYYNLDNYPTSGNPVDIENDTPDGSAVTAWAAAVADLNYRIGSTSWLAGIGASLVPSRPLTAGFEKGANGATVLTTDPGDGDMWDSTSAAVPPDSIRIYDTTHAAFGSQSWKLLTVASSGCSLSWGPSAKLGTLVDHYGRLYLYLTGNPPANQILVRVLSGASTACAVNITTGGKILVNDAGSTTRATGAVSVTLNQWVRIEWHVTHSTTAGVVEAKLFNTASSSTPSETITGAGAFSTLASADTLRFGIVSALANYGPLWIDQIAAAAENYPGPA